MGLMTRASDGPRALANRILDVVVDWGVLPWLVAFALVERVGTSRRRGRGERPRLIWGPIPIISLKYWSKGTRKRGFEALTCVTVHLPINVKEDFDVYRSRFEGTGLLAVRLVDHKFFAWTLRRGDVFIRFFDGGFLRHTHLKWLEAPLLRLAGKKLVVSPYGSDVAVSGHLGDLEGPLFTDYPTLRDRSDLTKRWVLHTSRWANLCVRHQQPGFVPRFDATLPNHFAIDMDEFGEEPTYSEADGSGDPVTVFHAPNHRHIKGSEYLIEAVDELRGEGLAIELNLVQGRPNSEVREMLAASDIAADQFLLPGYAMFSLEAMAAGRPVLNNIRTLPPELLETEVLRACPAVDADPERLKNELRALAQDPERRREIGLAGRDFVRRFHSIDALGREWEALIDHVWTGAPLPERLCAGVRPASG